MDLLNVNCVFIKSIIFYSFNLIGGVLVSVLASSSVVDLGFEARSGKTKDYKIGIFCFSAKHAALSRKEHHKTPTQRVGLAQSGLHHLLIED